MPVWKPAAIADRKAIVTYIGKDSPKAAVEMGDMLMQKAEQLDKHQGIGRIGRVKGTRELVAHPNYVLVYRVEDNQVEILRVLHARRQWP